MKKVLVSNNKRKAKWAVTLALLLTVIFLVIVGIIIGLILFVMEPDRYWIFRYILVPVSILVIIVSIISAWKAYSRYRE